MTDCEQPGTVTLTAEEAALALWAVQMLPGRRTAAFAALAARLRLAAEGRDTP